MQKFFIVGCSRSGTTVLQQALNRHPAIAIPPETGYFSEFLGHSRMGQRQHLKRLNRDLEIELPPPPRRVREPEEAVAFFERLAALYVARLGRPEIAWFGEKTPQHLLHIHRLARLFPGAKVLLVYRDGRDVAASLCRVPWAPDDLYLNFAWWLRYYRWHRRAEALRSIDLLPVRYETLVTRPEAVLREVVEFLDLPYQPAMAGEHGNREGVPEREHAWKGRALGRITAERVDRWRRELSPTQIARLERWGGWALEELGYQLVTDRSRPLPATFFLRLCWHRARWLARCTPRLLAKELLAR